MIIFFRGGLVKPRFGRDVDLAADDGMDPLFFARAVEIDHAVHHAVVGDGKGIKALALRRLRDLTDAARAVEQAVFGMNMKMCEWHFTHLLPLRALVRR